MVVLILQFDIRNDYENDVKDGHGHRSPSTIVIIYD